MAAPSTAPPSSLLAGFESYPALTDSQHPDRSMVNPQHGRRSGAYDVFPDPLSKGRRGGFDVHIYYNQNNPQQTEYARHLYRRIRHEFPELRIYRLWAQPIGPHITAMFEVNLFSPAQFGAFVPWVMVHRGPLSALVHPNTDTPLNLSGRVDVEAEVGDHIVRPAWIGERLPLDEGLLRGGLEQKKTRVDREFAEAEAEVDKGKAH